MHSRAAPHRTSSYADSKLNLCSNDQGEAGDGGGAQQQQQQQHVWEKWSTDGTEKQVAKLMEEDIGAAMQFLQSKALCMMPVSLAMAIYDTQHPLDGHGHSLKPEPNASS
jgi:hypothetical protein